MYKSSVRMKRGRFRTTANRRGRGETSPPAARMTCLYGEPCKHRLQNGQSHVLTYMTRIRVCSQNRLHRPFKIPIPPTASSTHEWPRRFRPCQTQE